MSSIVRVRPEVPAPGVRKQNRPSVVAPDMTRTQLQPSADHPITVTPTDGRVVVEIGGHVLATSDRALTLQESTYPAVQYVPLADVDQALLRPSDTQTYCPFKGDATYYDVAVDGATTADVIWTYATPYEAVDAIAGHVAFYPDKTTIRVEAGPTS